MESTWRTLTVPGVGLLGCRGRGFRVGVWGMVSGRRPMIWSIARYAITAAALTVLANPALSDTLDVALAQAYQNNPSLNAQRAALRATDEGVPIALSGYRPRVTGTITTGATGQNQTTKVVGS